MKFLKVDVIDKLKCEEDLTRTSNGKKRKIDLKSSKGCSNIIVYYCSKNFRSQNPTQIKKSFTIEGRRRKKKKVTYQIRQFFCGHYKVYKV